VVILLCLLLVLIVVLFALADLHRAHKRQRRGREAVEQMIAAQIWAAGFRPAELDEDLDDSLVTFDDVAELLPADVVRDITEGPAQGTLSPVDPFAPVHVDIYADDTPQTLAARYGRHVAELAWAEYSRGALPHLIVYPGASRGT
jgi:hypothetical protein